MWRSPRCHPQLLPRSGVLGRCGCVLEKRDLADEQKLAELAAKNIPAIRPFEDGRHHAFFRQVMVASGRP